MNFEKYNLFEECVAKMFSEEELVVSRQYRTEKNMEIDNFVEKNEIKYCIEIKYSPIQDNAVRQIHTIAKECNAEAILVTIYELELDHVLA